MKTVKFTLRKQRQIEKAKLEKRQIPRRMWAVEQTDESIIYECIECGKKHTFIRYAPDGQLIKPGFLFRWHSKKSKGASTGFCPYCSPQPKK